MTDFSFSQRDNLTCKKKKHRDLRALRQLFQKEMPRVQNLLGSRHCLLQLCTTRPKRCCKKLVKESTEAIHPYLHDGTTTTSTEIRCHSLSGPSRKKLPFDRIALENHSFVATKAERNRHSEHWIFTLNQEGAQQPLHQRPDFAQAKRECKRLHDEHMAKTQQDYRTILRSQQIRQRKGQAFEEIEEYDCAVDPPTGWRFFQESRGDLPTASSS